MGEGSTVGRKQRDFKLALDRRRLGASLDALADERLFQLAHDLGKYVNVWPGEPLPESVEVLARSIPLLAETIDFATVLGRLSNSGPFPSGVRTEEFFPELSAVHRAVIARVKTIPAGVEKAELCLRPYASDAGAGPAVEAATYFASRNRADLVNVDVLTGSWYQAILADVLHPYRTRLLPERIRLRAEAGSLTLAECALCLCGNRSWSFFSCGRRDKTFIDAAMFRTIEWLDLAGFEPWLGLPISDLSQGPELGIFGEVELGWWLFHWCRSDLALRMADRFGLEAWLRAAMTPDRPQQSPWHIYWQDQDDRGLRDYLPLAGIIPFLWHRIQPQHLSDDLVPAALRLLGQTQLTDGGWPLLLGKDRSSVLSTCTALHALGVHQPPGWERLAARAYQWLLTQQGPRGLWRGEGGMNEVMLAVLVLDSLELARGGSELTFGPRRAKTTEERYVFRQDGDGFAIVFEGRRLPAVSNLVGLRYLHLLLEHEGRDLDVLALRQLAQRAVTPPAPTLDELADQEFVGGLEGDLGEIMDEQGEKLFRKEAERLKDSIEESRAFGRDDEVVRLTQELEVLAEQVRAARGLAGRKRVSGSPANRARTSVLHAIKHALERLNERDPALHDHLKAALTTGTVCRYAPDHPLPWHLR